MSNSSKLINLTGRRQTPYIPQAEASECALACLAMVAGYYGYDTDLITLRHRYGMSLKGASLKQMMHVADEIGFRARPVRGEIEDLDHLQLPTILHWDLNHFVVLTAITGNIASKFYHINDPARGSIKLRERDVSRYWSGVALDLLPTSEFQPRIDRRSFEIHHLWSRMTGFWGTIRQIFFLSLVMQISAVATPFLLQISIDTVFPAFDRDLLLVLSAGFLGVTLIGILASWLRSLIIVSLSNSLSYQVVSNLFGHLLSLPMEFFEKRHVGDIISRFGSTQPISQLLSQGMISACVDAVMAILTIVLMFIYSPLLCMITVSFMILFLFLRLLFLEVLRAQNLNVITAIAKENSNFIESVRGISAIKAFGQEDNRRRLWQRSKAEAVNAQVKLGRVTASFDSIGQAILGVERIVFVYLAVGLALDSVFTIGMIFAFQSYKQHFFDAGVRLTEQIINFQVMKVHLTRIADIALSRREDLDAMKFSDDPDFTVPLILERVCYRYGVNEPMVLNDINLTIMPGEFIAITGASGGGKTTLVKILMGLFEPTAGNLKLGDRPVTSYRTSKYRQLIGSVAQGDMLYAGSLAENISFFDPQIDMMRVREVASLARIDGEIQSMPMGYETLVGDMGSVLSGGQLQRVLLARALYSNPKVLILDEGTANLDNENEVLILNMLKELNITRIAIAHRPATMQAADKCFTISNGRLVGVPKNNSAVNKMERSPTFSARFNSMS